MSLRDWTVNPEFIKRNFVGYFAPLLAFVRLIKKRRVNYIQEMRVLYRYAFWKMPIFIHGRKRKKLEFIDLDDYIATLPAERQEAIQATSKRMLKEVQKQKQGCRTPRLRRRCSLFGSGATKN